MNANHGQDLNPEEQTHTVVLEMNEHFFHARTAMSFAVTLRDFQESKPDTKFYLYFSGKLVTDSPDLNLSLLG